MCKIIVMLLILCAMPGIAYSQQPSESTMPKSSPISTVQESKPPAEQPLMQIAEGTLTRVDAQKELIWIKKLDGKEMQFSYSKETQVEGARNTVEGLAKTNDSELKIHYRTEGGINTAIRIEVQAPKAQAVDGAQEWLDRRD